MPDRCARFAADWESTASPAARDQADQTDARTMRCRGRRTGSTHQADHTWPSTNSWPSTHHRGRAPATPARLRSRGPGGRALASQTAKATDEISTRSRHADRDQEAVGSIKTSVQPLVIKITTAISSAPNSRVPRPRRLRSIQRTRPAPRKSPHRTQSQPRRQQTSAVSIAVFGQTLVNSPPARSQRSTAFQTIAAAA